MEEEEDRIYSVLQQRRLTKPDNFIRCAVTEKERWDKLMRMKPKKRNGNILEFTIK